MKIEHSRRSLHRAALSIHIIALFLTVAGCGGYGSSSGGGGGGGGGGGLPPSITSLNPTSGPVGTSVTIAGSYFGATQGTSTVKFNGTTATPTGWSATSITAQVPQGATNGNVVVTVGGVPSNGVAFTVTTATSVSGSWTFLQDSITTGCTAGASSCTISLINGNMLPTTAGSVWMVIASTGNNVTISSVTGGGGTWTPCPASGCHAFDSTLVRNVDAYYNLSGNGGTTSITVNLSGSSTNLLKVNFIELLPPPGSTASFDAAGTSTSNTCTTACPGVGLTLTGTDAVIQFQGIHDPTGWNAWSSPYITDYQGDGIYLNATSGAAPTVNMTAAGAIITALAFKSTAGSFTPPTQPISVVNYTNPPLTSCSATCSLTIPSSGSGHLLYIEAADRTSNYIASVSGGGTWVIPSSCQITLSGGLALSCGYVLSSTSGATSLSVTMNGNSSVFFAVTEVAVTSGTFALDAQGSTTNGASLHPSGQALTLTGTNDVIFQAIFCPGGSSAVTLYPMPYIRGNGNQFYNNDAAQGVLLNTRKGTAPQWANEQNSATVVTAMAFKTVTGTAPAPPTGLAALVN